MEEAESHYGRPVTEPATEKEAAMPASPPQPKPKPKTTERPKPKTTERTTPSIVEGAKLQLMGWKVRPSVIIMGVLLVMLLIFGGSILFSLRGVRARSIEIQ